MILVIDWIQQTLFARKLVDDVRSIEANALFTIEVPQQVLWKIGSYGGGVDDAQSTTTTAATAATTTTICALLPPDFGFYFQLVVIVLFQSLVFNAILGAFVYKIVIEPKRQQQQQQQHQNQQQNKSAIVPKVSDDDGDDGVSMAAVLFAFGIAIPCVVLEPIYAIRSLEIQNLGLIMVFLATPIVNSLRIAEALYGFAPVLATTSLWNYVFYFSCLFGMEFDPSTRAPRRVSKDFFVKRLKTLGRDFCIVSMVICVLKQCDYEFFDITITSTSPSHTTTTTTAAAVDSMDHTLFEMISWKHLLNNFLVAFLISASLSQSSIGVSLIYNIFYGVQTYEIVLNPMLKSKSPSDFWGRRWNVLVHNCLKNGVYKPTRKHTSSKLWAVVATFVVSGIIHEYVNFVMFHNNTSNSEGGTTNENDDLEAITTAYRFTWKQMLFFGWNGVLILLEYSIGHWGVFRWMSRTLPPIATTALVLCCALPLAHLFTGDWIRHGYFDAVYLASPIVVCQHQ